jgi:hypothetical protein
MKHMAFAESEDNNACMLVVLRNERNVVCVTPQSRATHTMSNVESRATHTMSNVESRATHTMSSVEFLNTAKHATCTESKGHMFVDSACVFVCERVLLRCGAARSSKYKAHVSKTVGLIDCGMLGASAWAHGWQLCG